MEVEPIRSSGATLTEALSAAQAQMNPAPQSAVSPSEEKGSGFFARLLDSLRSEPSWAEHPWQVGVNRHSMKVEATRWAKKQAGTPAEDLAPLRVVDGKSVQPKSSVSATPAPRTESVVLPSPAKKPAAPEEQGVTPTTKTAPKKLGGASKEQSYGYGIEEVLPKELLKESPLLQRTQAEEAPTNAPSVEVTIPKSPPATKFSDEPADESPDEVSWRVESVLSEVQSLLMARVYGEAVLLPARQGSFDGQA